MVNFDKMQITFAFLQNNNYGSIQAAYEKFISGSKKFPNLVVGNIYSIMDTCKDIEEGVSEIMQNCESMNYYNSPNR